MRPCSVIVASIGVVDALWLFMNPIPVVVVAYMVVACSSRHDLVFIFPQVFGIQVVREEDGREDDYS